MKKTPIKSIQELRTLTRNSEKQFAIALNFGVFSKKTIKWSIKQKIFIITNHIDDSRQRLTKEEINDKELTHIGEAIKKKALFLL